LSGRGKNIDRRAPRYLTNKITRSSEIESTFVFAYLASYNLPISSKAFFRLIAAETVTSALEAPDGYAQKE